MLNCPRLRWSISSMATTLSVAFFLLPGVRCEAIHFGEPLSPDQYPNVGQVIILDADGKPLSSGTGTLIAPDLVLTVAHVVLNSRTPFHIKFQLDSDPKSDYRGMAYRIHPEYYGIKSYNADSNSLRLQSMASDVALLRLLRPVAGSGGFPELSSSPLERSAVATVVGYGYNESKQGGRRRSGSLKYLSPKHDYLMFGAGSNRFQRCDHGDSGGPLFVQRGPKTEIVALVHGGAEFSDFKDLASDEYCLHVSVALHRAWIERARAELAQIPDNLTEYVFAIRNVADAEMPAISLEQFFAMAQAGMQDDRLLQRISVRGASNPIPDRLAAAFVKIGFSKSGFVVVKPAKANSR